MDPPTTKAVLAADHNAADSVLFLLRTCIICSQTLFVVRTQELFGNGGTVPTMIINTGLTQLR